PTRAPATPTGAGIRAPSPPVRSASAGCGTVSRRLPRRRPAPGDVASLWSQPSAQIHPMTHRMKVRAALAPLALALAATAARGEPASESAACSAEALGTARVLPIEAVTTPRVGRKHFHDTLPLPPKAAVLTFHDRPA